VLRRLIAVLAVTALMVVTMVTPVLAQPQVGLVNVDIDITDNVVIVQLPIGIAANVCNVGANVLAQDIVQTGTAECEAAVDQDL
jgi:hypothetical protein